MNTDRPALSSQYAGGSSVDLGANTSTGAGGADLWLAFGAGGGVGASTSGSRHGINPDGPALSAQYASGSGGGQAILSAAAGSGGLLIVLFDASQTTAANAGNQPGSAGATVLALADPQSTRVPQLLDTTLQVVSFTHAVQLGTPTISYADEHSVGAFDVQWQLAAEQPRTTLYHGLDPAEVTWTAEDRQAAIRAQGAYAFDGGLLKEFGIPYRPKDGFSASLFIGADGTFYLAFRGTEPTSWEDWWADLVQGGGFTTSQYEQALELAERVKQITEARGARLVVTGHSLGGGLALAASYDQGLDAIVFNPATSNDTYSQGNPGDIRSHIVAGDILSVGRTIGHLGQLPVLRRRSAPGLNVIHPPTYLNTHGMDNFPIDDWNNQ